MKATTALLSLLPAALAADEPCIADCHCSDNCPRVASADFALSGGNRVATAPGWASMSVNDANSTVMVENFSDSTLTVLVYPVICYWVFPHTSCTAEGPRDFNTTFGMWVYEHR